MNVTVVAGDLLQQPTEAIVNPWNCNIIPWWLLLPHGVSGAIKRRAGLAPFRELGRLGRLAPGSAVTTGAGNLPYRAIIHVASIDMLGRTSAAIIEQAVCNAVHTAERQALRSLAFPLLGTGSGRFPAAEAERLMHATFARLESRMAVLLVRYAP